MLKNKKRENLSNPKNQLYTILIRQRHKNGKVTSNKVLTIGKLPLKMQAGKMQFAANTGQKTIQV